MEMNYTYDDLLSRLRSNLDSEGTKRVSRLEMPEPSVMWIGNKTIFRNFMDFPRTLRRDPGRFLMYLAKELATAASLDGDRAIFIGRKDSASFKALIQRYMKESVICPSCGNLDTHVEKVKRLQLLVCEACGARSPTKSIG